MTNIQLHRLEGFYWVAREGGYAKAARAFPYPITQPAVHQQVKKLESELGLALFERVGKETMRLTAAGSRLYDFAAPYYEGLPGLLRSLLDGDYRGTIRIQSAGTALRFLLPGWLKRLEKKHPQVQVELSELTNYELDDLRHGQADMLIDYVPEIPDDMASMQVAVMRAFLVFSADHPLAKKKSVKVSDLAEDRFVSYPPGSRPYSLQMKGLALHGVAPPGTYSVGTADAILGFVESGLGYSLVPSLDPKGPKSRGLISIPLNSPKVEFPVYAVWRKNTPENPLLDAVLETAPKVS